MKKIILATLLIGKMGGCTEKNNSNLPYGAMVFNFEGHNYITYRKGGLIHSESCKCKGGNK